MDEALTHAQAAERLLDDERWRADLSDDEARTLLDWALAELGAAAARGEPLAPFVDRLRATARQVNDLVGARVDLDAAAFAARLRSLAGLPDPGPLGHWRRWLGQGDAADALARRLPDLDGPALVRAVLALIAPATSEVRP